MMKKVFMKLTLFLFTAVFVSGTAMVNGAVINGNMENWSDENELPDSWVEDGNSLAFERVDSLTDTTWALEMATGAIGQNNAGALFSSDLDTTYDLGFDFAHESPDSDRSLNMTWVDSSDEISLQMRVNDSNTLQMYDGSAWQDVPDTSGAVTGSNFSEDNLTVFRVSVSGDLSTNDAPKISLFDVTNSTSIADGVDGWYRNQLNDLAEARFNMVESNGNETAYRVDNVTAIPEPSTLLLFGLAGLLLMKRRRL